MLRPPLRWTETPAEEIAIIRRDLLKANDRDFMEIVRLLAHDEYCSAVLLLELGRTPSFRRRMAQVGLLPPLRGIDGHWHDAHRLGGYRTILAKFGIPVPTPRG